MTTFSRTGSQMARAAGTTVAVGLLLVVSACGSSGPGGTASGTTKAGPAAGAASGGKAVGVGTTSVGKVLVSSSGMTLYAFAADKPGTSNCSGSCLKYWPPAAGNAAPSHPAAVTAKLGTIKRSDGSTQLTANGFPMYTYVGDSAAGQANGQGMNISGGLWWAVSPSGSWLKKAASTTGGGTGGGTGGY
jgi:predicted lipoprotein with Yx(FWY)xxD motif